MRLFDDASRQSVMAATLLLWMGGTAIAGSIPWTTETPAVLESVNDGDADDPAIWLHPTDRAQSLVFGTRKKNGLGVYDLSGNQVSEISPPNDETLRFNNVNVEYNFQLGGKKVDLAIVSDRITNTIRIFEINPQTPGSLLTEVTSATQPLAFPEFLEAGEDTAYGLATYRDRKTGKLYAFVSQNDNDEVPETQGNLVRQFELVDEAGAVKAVPLRTITLPTTDPLGVELRTIADPTDPGDVLDRKAEGMAVDVLTGELYIGQERVGIWKIDADPAAGDITLDYATHSLVDHAKVHDGKGPLGAGNLVNDIEGLSISYDRNGGGYLVVSSQGSSEFALYDRTGGNDFLGLFNVVDPGIGGDDADHSDGTDILVSNLGPLFPFGLLVVHDGENLPDVGEDNTNFKYVALTDLAAGFEGGGVLEFNVDAFNPRTGQLVPEPSTWALLAAGLIALARRGRRQR